MEASPSPSNPILRNMVSPTDFAQRSLQQNYAPENSAREVPRYLDRHRARLAFYNARNQRMRRNAVTQASRPFANTTGWICNHNIAAPTFPSGFASDGALYHATPPMVPVMQEHIHYPSLNDFSLQRRHGQQVLMVDSPMQQSSMSLVSTPPVSMPLTSLPTTSMSKVSMAPTSMPQASMSQPSISQVSTPLFPIQPAEVQQVPVLQRIKEEPSPITQTPSTPRVEADTRPSVIQEPSPSTSDPPLQETFTSTRHAEYDMLPIIDTMHPLSPPPSSPVVGGEFHSSLRYARDGSPSAGLEFLLRYDSLASRLNEFEDNITAEGLFPLSDTQPWLQDEPQNETQDGPGTAHQG